MAAARSIGKDHSAGVLADGATFAAIGDFRQDMQVWPKRGWRSGTLT